MGWLQYGITNIVLIITITEAVYLDIRKSGTHPLSNIECLELANFLILYRFFLQVSNLCIIFKDRKKLKVWNNPES